MEKVVLLALLAVVSLTIEFTVNLEPLSEHCGYEHLISQTKYVFAISPHAQHSYSIEVKTMETVQNPQVKVIFSDSPKFPVKISKLIPESNFYSFCVKNTGDVSMDFSFTVKTGIQLMDFTETPDTGEMNIVNHELSLIEEETSVMMRELESIEHARNNTEDMFRMMSLRTLGFGILGGVILAVANLGLYYEFRKTLREFKVA